MRNIICTGLLVPAIREACYRAVWTDLTLANLDICILKAPSHWYDSTAAAMFRFQYTMTHTIRQVWISLHFLSMAMKVLWSPSAWGKHQKVTVVHLFGDALEWLQNCDFSTFAARESVGSMRTLMWRILCFSLFVMSLFGFYFHWTKAMFYLTGGLQAQQSVYWPQPVAFCLRYRSLPNWLVSMQETLDLDPKSRGGWWCTLIHTELIGLAGFSAKNSDNRSWEISRGCVFLSC